MTDNYLRRSYNAMLSQLHPDSVFFLGDLFDGGREWKTARGHFVDPKWGLPRDEDEAKLLKKWRRKYGEDYWLREYKRFGSIFVDPWNRYGDTPGAWQRGRKLIASLPGNHDLGYGAQVQLPVRDRFSAFFGDTNRVDVVGNHTIVSVDAVSLGADTYQFKEEVDAVPIYAPVNEFLADVKAAKRRAVQEEVSVWHGYDHQQFFEHSVDDLESADLSRFPGPDLSLPDVADLPTILLTHVPLYREPGTPCGPRREHWPPAKPPKGQTDPVYPDEPNGIPVVAGYQYQNVLNEEDSVKLVRSIGNVVHVFSGDDHDYCEVVHNAAKENVREITVKSLSMAMNVPTPGFVMVSLYNPVDGRGASLPGAPSSTLQTHLCLLPNQLHTYMKYVSFILVSLVVLAIRALLVPALNLAPFALGPDSRSLAASLPVFKDKTDPPDLASVAGAAPTSRLSGHDVPTRMSGADSRGSSSNGSIPSNGSGAALWTSKRGASGGRYRKRWDDWADGPRISLDESFYHSDDKAWREGRRRRMLGTAWLEMWTTTWRVVWMVLAVFFYLGRHPL